MSKPGQTGKLRMVGEESPFAQRNGGSITGPPVYIQYCNFRRL